jgi:hypothetical protein
VAFLSSDVKTVAAEIDAEIRALPVQNTPGVRALRRTYSRKLSRADPEFVLALARELVYSYGYREPAYELVQNHREAFRNLGPAELEELGRGMDSWWSHSNDLGWRRAALVSTVALNVRSHGGSGDTGRTLAVCGLLVDDHEDMVVKALSWALRALVVHDPEAVRGFLEMHEGRLAARVLREVNNKLATGLKNPRRDG